MTTNIQNTFENIQHILLRLELETKVCNPGVTFIDT